MELIRQFVDFFLHLDQHIGEMIRQYGTGTYVILFLIVFAETGLVVMPLLPGDSLLFAAGAFAALGDLDPWLLGSIRERFVGLTLLVGAGGVIYGLACFATGAYRPADLKQLTAARRTSTTKE